HYFKYCPRCGGRLADRRERRGEPIRQICSDCGFILYDNPIPTADAVIIKNGRALLMRRAWPPRQGEWDVPGGFMEVGETPLEAARREVKEEIGLSFSAKELLGIYPGTYDWQGRRRHTLSIVFVGTATGRLKPSVEASELRWFPIGSLPTVMAFPHQRWAVRDLKKYLRRR
ncbi:MAG: NUDIX hydrolase, partial [Candidatus Kerfeldbacteria bacterium]|nr:NUDIX hydrolase [Candidatus Kerfeldbacteria bacterium]